MLRVRFHSPSSPLPHPSTPASLSFRFLRPLSLLLAPRPRVCPAAQWGTSRIQLGKIFRKNRSRRSLLREFSSITIQRFFSNLSVEMLPSCVPSKNLYPQQLYFNFHFPLASQDDDKLEARVVVPDVVLVPPITKFPQYPNA